MEAAFYGYITDSNTIIRNIILWKGPFCIMSTFTFEVYFVDNYLLLRKVFKSGLLVAMEYFYIVIYFYFYPSKMI